MIEARGAYILAPPLDGEGLGWGDARACAALFAYVTPTLPSPIKGEGL